jgi:CHAD domain-containing protein
VKARKVKGLDPDGPLLDNARRIVLTRLDELHSFSPAVLDPDEQQALHDMRIAAKRLRYVLEVTEPCFGPEARRGAKVARGLQGMLGEIHDCDVMLPRVRRHLEDLRAADAATMRSRADGRATDLDPAAARSAPNRSRYRGLESLAAYLIARREVLYAAFLDEWSSLERNGFRARLERTLSPQRGG